MGTINIDSELMQEIHSSQNSGQPQGSKANRNMFYDEGNAEWQNESEWDDEE